MNNCSMYQSGDLRIMCSKTKFEDENQKKNDNRDFVYIKYSF